MKEMINILIVDDNAEFAELLKRFISRHDDMKVVGVAADGVEAVEMISILMPDVVILDIIMPNLDGLGVLERFSSSRNVIRPLFIVLSAIGQDGFIKEAISLGAEYYFIKPFDMNVLVSRIRQIFHENHSSHIISLNNKVNNYELPEPCPMPGENTRGNIEASVTNLMRKIAVSPHMLGYRYLKEAILYCIEDPGVINSVTKTLYPYIAEKFDSSVQKVERAMRNAIDKAWKQAKPSNKETIFGTLIGSKPVKPKNSEFIAIIADKIRIGLK